MTNLILANFALVMIQLIQAQTAHIPIIRRIAQETWPKTFGGILAEEQINYMLEMMYSEASLAHQVTELGHQFVLAQDTEDDRYLGYLSYERPYLGLPQTKIHKIYILPQTQGSGLGKLLMEAAEHAARQQGDRYLLLNVNKYNKAEAFYQRLGFETIGMEDIDIGNGYLMEDKIMRKTL